MAEAFKEELQYLTSKQRTVSASRIKTLTQLAIKYRKDYKIIVSLLEEFAEKCQPSYKLHALYVIDSICQASRSTSKKDLYVRRFAINILKTFEHLSNHDPSDTEKFKKVLRIWRERRIFRSDYMTMMESLIDLNPNVLVDAVPELEAREVRRRELKQKVRNELEHQSVLPDDDATLCESGDEGQSADSFPTILPQNKRTIKDESEDVKKAKKNENIFAFDYGDEEEEDMNEEDRRRFVEMQERLSHHQPTNQKTTTVEHSDGVIGAETKSDDMIIPVKNGVDVLENSYKETHKEHNIDTINTQRTETPTQNMLREMLESIDPYTLLFGANAQQGMQYQVSQQRPFYEQEQVPLPLREDSRGHSLSAEVPSGCVRVLTRTILLSNVSRSTTEEKIRSICSYYGAIDHIALFNDRGHAFVKYMTRRDAEKARVSMRDYSLDGNYLKAEWYSAFGPKQYFNSLSGSLEIPVVYLNERDRSLLTGASGIVEEPFPPQKNFASMPVAHESSSAPSRYRENVYQRR